MARKGPSELVIGAAHELAERFEAQQMAAIEGLFSNPLSEGQFLDFKRVIDSEWNPQSLGRSNLKSLSEAIAGFANTSGGLIIWGIECKARHPSGDIPSAKHPIVGLPAFVALLENSVATSTDPVHRFGVRSFPIPLDPADPSAGFAVTVVPQSPDAPLRDLREDRYPIRAGASFVSMPHSVLAAMFGRRPSPALELDVSLSREPAIDRFAAPGYDVLTAIFRIRVNNTGHGIARDVYAIAENWDFPNEISELYPFASQPFEELTRTRRGLEFYAMLPDGYRIAPFASAEGLHLRLKLKNEVGGDYGDGARIDYRFGCEGMPTRNRSLVFTPDMLREIRRSISQIGNSKELLRVVTGLIEEAIKCG